MKKLMIIILFFGICFSAFGRTINPINNENVSTINSPDKTDDAEKESIIRLQNKFIAGIETSLNPSWTADGGTMFRTLANFRVGYRLKQNVLTGSIGVEFTDEMFIPFTIDYKYYMKYNQKWSPFIYGQTGYSWHLKGNINSRYTTSNYKQIDPGAMASVGFGYSVTTNLNEFYFSVGYVYRDYVEVTVISSNDDKEHLDRSNNGIAFTVGLNF
ncbi:MAG: hypothetical protein JXR31_08765 [Prolixibacteraceae bacterium]|nr:hypothetical protein [Prolixibacteraceae bacterium]MBN2774323.1 hypothetical protein [Prolixibacteraceae bacterium]